MDLEESAAYRQLEKLREEALVEADRVRDGPGRPKKVYALTEAGWETFPRDYELLLSSMIEAIEAEEGRERLETYVGRIAEDLASSIAGEGDPRDRMRRLVELYNDLGFEAHLERESGETVLVQRNCPFRQIARSNPKTLCERLDEGIQRRVLPEAGVELEETMARGARRCEHRVTFPDDRIDDG